MTAPLYSIEGLQVVRGGRRVLDVDGLALAQGENTLIQGPNGAGKTTLLECLALLRRPTAGSLAFLGQEAANGAAPAELRRRVTLVAQEPYLFTTTVAANLAYGLKLRGVPRPERERAVEAGLARVGLAGFGPRRASQLSGGERQRVALARALVLGPSALLLDEPYANLDQEGQEVLDQLLGELPGRGTSVVMVAHHRVASRLAFARSVTLERGRLAEG